MVKNRQLAAIMFTDIVGYTAMMQQDEQKAISILKRHKSVLEQSVSKHHGDLIEYYGDGSLSIFSSVTEALDCATAIQQQLQKTPPIPLRIGLHTGEILFEEGKVMGDGVNLASRIQALGQAGSILFSKEIYDKIRNHPEFKPVPLGAFALKNVDEPMQVFALSGDGLTVPDIEAMESRFQEADKKNASGRRMQWGMIALVVLVVIAAVIWNFSSKSHAGFTGKEKSIAVLPFENIGNDTLQEYFSDGITEDIITQLSKIADLKVISRTSVMQYKNSDKNIKEIADELDVAAILEGSVRKEGDKVRINAQLIDANTDQHIWAEQYDRDASEVFAIQTEVAQQIALQLNARLTTEEGKRIGQKATGNIKAYEYYLKAKQASPREREQLLRKALSEDSTFALAWSELARVYSFRPGRDPGERPMYIQKALDAALTALHYGPELSETHMNLGDVLKIVTLNPALSIRELKESIALNPNNAEAYVYLAYAQMELGRFNEAEQNLTKAKGLDPLSGIMWAAWMKYYRYTRDAEKIAEIVRQLPVQARTGWEHEFHFWYHFLKENKDSLLVYGMQLRDPAWKGISFAVSGKIKEAKQMADSLEAVSPYDNAFNIAVINAWLGDKEKAIEYLDLAYRLYDYDLIGIKADKIFDPLRNEDGFKKILHKMGLE